MIVARRRRQLSVDLEPHGVPLPRKARSISARRLNGTRFPAKMRETAARLLMVLPGLSVSAYRALNVLDPNNLGELLQLSAEALLDFHDLEGKCLKDVKCAIVRACSDCEIQAIRSLARRRNVPLNSRLDSL